MNNKDRLTALVQELNWFRVVYLSLSDTDLFKVMDRVAAEIHYDDLRDSGPFRRTEGE